MKKIVYVFAALTAAGLWFAGCQEPARNVPQPVPAAEYTVTFNTAGANGTLTAKAGGESITSPTKVKKGKTVEFTATPNTGLVADWTISGGLFENGTGSVGNNTAKVTVNSDITVSVSFRAVQQSDLYGAYWGSLEVAGGKFDMCMEIKKDFVGIHSDQMGFPYYVITFTDNKDGTWLVGCYNKGEDTTKPSTHVRVTIDTTKSPLSCKPYIVPMGDFTKFSDCVKGKPYNNEFKY